MKNILYPLLLCAACMAGLSFLPAFHSHAASHASCLKDTCKVQFEENFTYPDSLRKKVEAIIVDKFYEGISENGKTAWENSPDAPEYYLVTLRKNKVTFKYLGVVCQDKLILDNINECREQVKKLIKQ